ncbi:Splicing factor U2af 38 kDa subunit [Atta colombica]|uniref:Splicing factor U2af 38 kDa subunit n=1 Tax=Atta colombica TaxID=520822 RepID=A0A195BAU6_9HYME|nr:Splicing factor U2af 38 kDa subunit [Atta colombica]
MSLKNEASGHIRFFFKKIFTDIKINRIIDSLTMSRHRDVPDIGCYHWMETVASGKPYVFQQDGATCLLQNLYVNPQNSAKSADGSHLVANVSDEEMQEHYDNFFEDVFVECEDKYGEIEEMNVCDNLGDHLVGNVYIKFRREEDAERAVNDLNNRWFGGRPVYAELSPVTDFREACCRQYEMGECTRSGFCNFMHLKPISRELRRYLYSRKKSGRGRSRSRSRSRGRDRKRRSRSRDRRSRSKDRRKRDDKGRDGRSGRY